MLKHVGERFGRLVALQGGREGNQYWYICQCDCGNIVKVNASNLVGGTTKSCGCLRKELMREKLLIHGESGTRLYHIWKAMRKRCSNPNPQDAYLYADRGITVCQEWEDFNAFAKWAKSNGYSEELTIDRVDPNGNYSPDNCRWATWQEQANNKRGTVYVTIGDQTKTLVEWCKEKNVLYSTALHRLRKQHLTGERLFQYQKPGPQINIFSTEYGGKGQKWEEE